MSKGILAALAIFVFQFTAQPGAAQTRNPGSSTSSLSLPCSERPAGKGLRFVCKPPAFLAEENDDDDTVASGVRIILKLPEGTSLRIAVDQRTRISRVGEIVQGHVVESVYAFDEPVIPAGTMAIGHVTSIAPVPKLRLIESYADGNFSPARQYQVTFDRLLLPDGRDLVIDTIVSPGSADMVHLVSKPPKADEEQSDEHKNMATRAAEGAKDEVKGAIHQAGVSTQQAAGAVCEPGRMHRFMKFLRAQSPYKRQYLEVGTRFNASLKQDLDFGSETHSAEHLSQIGSIPLADSVLHARLMLEVSSATATRGAPVVAELTEPVYSSKHQLLLPAGSRLIGVVLEAKPARHLHRNGELRVIFEHIEVPGGNLEEVQGTLEGIEVDRSAHMKLDEEGGARATDSKTRYLSTGVALLLVAAATHPDLDHDAVDPAGDPAVRAGAGASGFGLAGTVIGLAAKSSVVSILFSAYGASTSIYTNFLSRGREVVLPKDAPLEIGLGIPHPSKH